MKKNLKKSFGKLAKINRKLTKRYSNFLEALTVSAGMAFLMLGVAFGLMFMNEEKKLPLDNPYILVILALTFIISTVFFEKQKVNRITSLIYGGLFSTFITFIIITVIGGVMLINTKTFPASNLPTSSEIISALAVCMIISMVIINLLSYD